MDKYYGTWWNQKTTYNLWTSERCLNSDVQKLTKAELVRKIALLNKITGNEDDILSAVHIQRAVKEGTLDSEGGGGLAVF